MTRPDNLDILVWIKTFYNNKIILLIPPIMVVNKIKSDYERKADLVNQSFVEKHS